MPIGSALAAAGTFLAKTALPAAGKFLAKKALPAVGKFVAKKALPALRKAAVSKIGGQLLSKGAPAAFSFGQARKAQGLQSEFQGQIDDLFASAKGRLDTDRSVSYTHLRAHETVLDLVCRLLLEKKK